MFEFSNKLPKIMELDSRNAQNMPAVLQKLCSWVGRVNHAIGPQICSLFATIYSLVYLLRIMGTTFLYAL